MAVYVGSVANKMAAVRKRFFEHLGFSFPVIIPPKLLTPLHEGLLLLQHEEFLHLIPSYSDKTRAGI
jgi:hypothetical protein